MNERKVLNIPSRTRAVNTVGVLRTNKKETELFYMQFGGVIDESELGKYRRLKVMNVQRFYWDEQGQSVPYYIPAGDIVVGALVNDKCVIAIRDNAPLHYKP
ncbi:hypothetical protein [Vibrio sp. Hal054]|uniref:hypothetical protein n=1 Tax=Vibrio sp. Hal054 TaxID=3035158 RepID=UPI00301C4268